MKNWSGLHEAWALWKHKLEAPNAHPSSLRPSSDHAGTQGIASRLDLHSQPTVCNNSHQQSVCVCFFDVLRAHHAMPWLSCFGNPVPFLCHKGPWLFHGLLGILPGTPLSQNLNDRWRKYLQFKLTGKTTRPFSCIHRTWIYTVTIR